jgi:hypothetical protein
VASATGSATQCADIEIISPPEARPDLGGLGPRCISRQELEKTANAFTAWIGNASKSVALPSSIAAK